MKSKPARHRFSPLIALGYLMSWPVMLLLGVYATVVLGLNTRPGALAVTELLDLALPGDVELAHVAIGPTLRRVEIFDARFRDFDGRDTIVARYATCVFRPLGLMLWRVHFDDCEVSDGQVLVHEEPDGLFGIEKVFAGEYARPGLAENPPLFRFSNVRLSNIDVMINVEDAFFVVEGISLREVGFEITNRSFQLAVGRADLNGGRIVVSERLVNLGDGRWDWGAVTWEAERSRRPWAVARSPLPSAPEGERGLLELPLHGGSIEGFRWDNYWFSFEEAGFLLADMEIEASGRVRLIPERPKVSPRERAILSFEGRARLSLTEDNPVLNWALPGIVSGSLDPDRPTRIEPLVVEGYGTMRFFDGEGRLAFHDLRILDWPVERFEADVSLRDGRLTLGDGARLDMWGGTITGGGSFVPRTGVWSMRLCARNLSLRDAVAPWLTGEEDSEMLAFLDARLDTDPDACGPDARSGGIFLGGELTLKALEVAPAATTPPDKQVQPPMIGLMARNLRLRWEEEPAWLPMRQVRLDLQGELDQRGRVRLGTGRQPGVQVRAGGSRLALTALVDTVEGVFRSGTLSVQTDDLGAWARRFGVEGLPQNVRLQVDGPFDGPLGAPRFGTTRIRSSLAEPSGFVPSFEMMAEVRTTPRDLEVGRLTVDSPAGALRGSGRLGLFDGDLWTFRQDPSLQFDAVLDEVALEFFVTDLDIGARVSGELDVDGRVSRPRIRGELRAEDMQVLAEPVEEAEATFEWRPGFVEVSALRVRKGLGELHGRGTWDERRNHLEMEANGCGLRPQDLSTLDELEIDLQGSFCFALDAVGDVSDPKVTGWLTADRVRVLQRSVGQVSLAFYTHPCLDGLAGQGCLELNGVVGGDFMVEGRLPMVRGPLSLTTHFADLSPQTYFRELRGVLGPSAVSGEAALYWDPRGTGALGVTLALDQLRFDVGDRRFAMARPSVLTWRMTPPSVRDDVRHRLLVEDFNLETEGRLVRVDGGLEDFETLDFSILGEVDLSLFRLLPDLVVDAEGAAAVDVRVGGTLSSPDLSGEAVFGEARVAPRGLGTNVLLAPGRVLLTSEAIIIPEDEPLRGILFGGDFSAAGRITLERLLPLGADLDVFVNGLVYRIPNELVITLLADVRFRALDFDDAESWSLSGDVEVLDARYFRNFDVIGDQVAFGEFRRPTQRFEPPIWQTVPELGAILLDLRVTGRDRFRVESRVASAMLQLELQLDLVVRDRLRQMVVLGEADILEGGLVNYRGRRFEVERGVLAFDGYRDDEGYPMPNLDMEMRSSIRPCVRRRRDTLNVGVDPSNRDLGAEENVLLTAYLDGRLPYEVAFQLESTPFYDQRDLLALVLTGCTVDELTAGAAGGHTLDLVFRPVIDAVERNVEERLAVDDVDIIPTAEGAAEITIRDEVTERLSWTLNARVGTEERNEQTVRVEYKLLDWLLLDVREQSAFEEGFTLDTGVRFRFRVD